MQVHFSGKTFDYQALRAMAYTTFGGAEPGEVLTTVERIEEGDTESWHTEWRSTAERVERLAEDAVQRGNQRTARGAYFRAHNYYRTAEFFLDADDPRRRPTYEDSRSSFRAGIERLDTDVQVFEIPYEGTTLPGYLFLPSGGDSPDKPHPTIVCVGGFDSIAEELYFLCGVPEALARGYAVVLFDGPGQGAPLRYQGLPTRPDWENILGPVLDAVEEFDTVDADAVGIIGVSMGGYFAPRAAAFEDRVAALVTFDHMYDLWKNSAYDAPLVARLLLYAPDLVVNGLATVASQFSIDARWTMGNAKWVFGVDSTAELQRVLPKYSVSGIARNIECPTLVLAGEDDHLVPLGLAQEFVDEITGPTTVRVFTTEEGAGEHCQVGNLSLATGVIYDWFDEVALGASPDRS